MKGGGVPADVATATFANCPRPGARRGWGLVAIAMVMATAVLVLLGLIENFSTPQLVLAAPIGLQEMVLAVWLIAKGFNPRAIAAESAGRTSIPRAAASGSAA